jgi:outer membrane protein TolC
MASFRLATLGSIVATAWLIAGCATTPDRQPPPAPPAAVASATPAQPPPKPDPPAPQAPTESSVVLASAEIEAPPLEELDGDTLNGRPVTLLSVLEVVDRDNPNINVARHRVEEAYAQWQRADSLWLPSIRAGINYNKHEGRIQDVAGNNIETSRGALFAGLGANAVGAASPAIPGIYANFHLADAVFQPRIAAYVTDARRANADATVNDYLLQAAQAYFELLRAEQERAIAQEIRDLAEKLAKLTESYAQTGQGLAADFDRASTELAIRRNDVLRAEEAARVASSRLAQLLRLDPTTPLVPQEPAMVPIHLFSSDEPVQSLVAQGLMSRPEVRESRALVCEAVNRLEREQYAPLIPSVLLGVSQGGFGAGLGGDIKSFADRFDADAVAWWELRNLGYGDAAARGEMRSRVQQARWREVSMLDQIAREVVEAHAQVQSRQQQLQIAQDAVKLARSSYDKNLDRIQNAEGLPLEVLQSLQALAQAQREYLRVVTDHNNAQFALQRATGTFVPAE